VAQYALDAEQPPLDTARRIREWPTYSKANVLAPLGEDECRVVVAVINQVKGLTFEATWVCALKPGKFPFRGLDSDSERCKFWVACTRATDLLVIHLPERDKRYLELAGSYTTVGSATTVMGAMARLSRHST
jgi:superfamily I DNA/RNA helicase